MESPRTLLQNQPAGPAPRRARPGGAVLRAPSPPQPAGDLILGRYRPLERLGAGGFGVVWRARDELLHREVAVKRIPLDAEGDPGIAERAAREAQAAARLAHPAIVALFEACPEGDAFYLISELVRGWTLARLLAAGELADEELLEIGIDLAEALEHAHERGVIHRDIKPQNVLVPDVPAARTARGRPVTAKLTDFGGASIAEEDALTRTGDVLGTLAYMSPEQCEGREAGPAADLYALALVLYESLAGENPVRGATPAATARRIGSPLPPLARYRHDLPAGLGHALDDAVSPLPADRGSLTDLREALEDALEDGLDAPPRRLRILPRRRREDVAPPLEAADAYAPAEPRPPELPAPHRPGAAEPAAAAEQPELPRVRGPLPDRGGLPRTLWVALALAPVAWLAVTGRPGVSLLLAAALAPLAAIPVEPYSRRVSPGWLVCALAPALGVIGLAGAFPALAGQPRRWRVRLALGAIGYWWLLLAEPLLSRRLWLGGPSATPRHVWEGSLTSSASHVIGPLLGPGPLLGALLWGVAAVLLPWVVRGTRAAFDVIATTVWAALLCSCAPALDAGLRAAGPHPMPRGAVLGAVLGGVLAIAARAVRGPV